MSDRLYNVPTELAAIGPRRSGRTTANVAAAVSIKATVVCAHQAHAEWMEKSFPGVRAVAKDRARSLVGATGPYLWDHYAVETLIFDFDSAVRDLISYKVKCEQLGAELLALKEAVAEGMKRKKTKRKKAVARASALKEPAR